ncbi:hypothetical protein BGZ72_001059, partial [Mortierella alpina]
MTWPIPDALTEINKLEGCKYLSFWDCKDGYLQSPIAEHCKYLTTVAFPDGLREYNVLPTGLISSFTVYQDLDLAMVSVKAAESDEGAQLLDVCGNGRHGDFVQLLGVCAHPFWAKDSTQELGPLAFQKAWNEDPKFERAFQGLQRSFLGAPVLVLINHGRPVIVSADTSDKATGYVLAHAAYECDDGNITIKTVYRPILFGSRKLSGAESRYFATERELL